MLRTIIAAVVLLIGTPLVAAPPALQIAVTGRITVSNVTSGGSIVLFSCSRVSQPRAIHLDPQARVLRDDDRDGVVSFNPVRVPLRSVWIAVDESSGRIAAGAPAEFPLLVKEIATDHLRKDVEGEIASLAADIPRLIVLLVRPGSGAWWLSGFDGNVHDRDGVSNGRIELSFEEAQPVDGKEKAPKHLKKDDVLAAIDPGHLDVFIAQVGR